MPWEVMTGYIVIDSIMRHPWGPNFRIEGCLTNPLSEYIRNLPVGDTLYQLYKHYYALVDYNPIIFKQYAEELGQGAPYIRSRYPLSLTRLINVLPETFERAFPDEDDYNKYFALLQSSHILRVRITGIDSIPPSRGFTQPLYGVNAEVLDTIKGKHFAPCHIRGENIEPATPVGEPVQTPCITLWHTNTLHCDEGGTSASFLPCTMPRYRSPCYKRVSVFYNNELFRYKFSVGQEAVIFTQVGILPTQNKQADFLEAGLHNRVSAAALYIDENDMVHDPNRIWSDQAVLPYQQWKSIVQQHINNILTQNYGE